MSELQLLSIQCVLSGWIKAVPYFWLLHFILLTIIVTVLNFVLIWQRQFIQIYNIMPKTVKDSQKRGLFSKFYKTLNTKFNFNKKKNKWYNFLSYLWPISTVLCSPALLLSSTLSTTSYFQQIFPLFLLSLVILFPLICLIQLFLYFCLKLYLILLIWPTKHNFITFYLSCQKNPKYHLTNLKQTDNYFFPNN